jgi:mannose-6-phosphate isomerase-like protein (cupin superfamily)
MSWLACRWIGLFWLLVPGLCHAQTSAGRPPGVYKSAAEIAAALDKGIGPLGIVAGQRVDITPGMVLRRRLAGPNNASVHSVETDKQHVTEVYQIVDGAGTFVTGGTLADPNDRTAGISGGEAHRVSKGDFIIIPTGTPHWFREIEGSITYLEIRFPATQ